MRGAVTDKVLADLAGVPVLVRSLGAFARTKAFRRLIIVTRDAEQESTIRRLLAGLVLPPVVFAVGGRERSDSVRAGLQALSSGTRWVAIHDGARPLIRPETILSALEFAGKDGAAVVAHRVVDTIKRVPVSAGLSRTILEDLERSRLWAMETPQIFRRRWIEAGYAERRVSVTDDVAAVTALGYGVTIVENEYPNPKITRPEDLAWAAHLLESGA